MGAGQTIRQQATQLISNLTTKIRFTDRRHTDDMGILVSNPNNVYSNTKQYMTTRRLKKEHLIKQTIDDYQLL